MNECWIIDQTGKGAKRDVQPPDLEQLSSNGYVEFRLQHTSDDYSLVRTSHVYVHPKFKPGNRDMFAAGEGLFGRGGAYQLWGPDGRIWP